MKLNKSTKWKVALGASVVATLGILPQLRAELVYEPEISPNAPAQVRADDREQTREALDSSVRVQNTVQASRPAPVSVPIQIQPTVQIAPTQETAAPQAVVQSLSKTELMRRERTREELKNEDILQERLEELRLRDEKKRTGQLLGDGSQAPAGEQAVAPIPGLAAQPQSQIVVSPVTERPGQAAPEVVAPIPSPAQAQQYSGTKSAYTPAAQDQINASQAVATSVASDETPARQFSITPRAGVSSMSTNSGFNVSGHYTAGIEGGVAISDNITFTLGYSYSEYGVSYGNQANLYAAGTTFDAYTLKQNVIDTGLKLYFLGPDSKLRPFIGGGFGYGVAYLNYPNSLNNGYGTASDFTSKSYLGSLSAGLDMKVNKSISIGAQFKYYTVLSVNENGNLYYGATNGAYPNGFAQPFVGGSADPSKTLAGASLAQSAFYSMTGGITFSF